MFVIEAWLPIPASKALEDGDVISCLCVEVIFISYFISEKENSPGISGD